MNTARSSFRPAALTLGIAVCATAWATPTMAAGIAAGTLIENTATATYTSGASGGSVTSNKVTLKVDELLDVAVATLSSTPATASSAPAVLAYSVTNSGNGPEAFKLSANPQVTGNGFDGTVASIVADTNDNGIYDAGIDQVLAAGTVTPSLDPDKSLKIFVLVTLPAGATDAATSQVRLTAAAATGTGTPGTVFAAQGNGGGDAVVGTTTAEANSLASLVASLASVGLAKSAVILDQFGTAKPVPGATVTYTLTASVSGTGSVEGLHIVDGIPTGTTYVPGTLKLDGAVLTDGADTDSGTAGSTGIDVALGKVNGGSTRTINFAVKIN
jgi:uncharacterized repeat protein (TIGR01451 family)